MYKVTITKIEDVIKTEQGAWTIIDSVPYREEDLKDVYDPESYAGQTKDVRGYQPNREVTKVVETEVLQQTMEDLDLTQVIMAINNIKEGVYHD